MPPSNQHDEDWHFDVPEPDVTDDDEREPEPEPKRVRLRPVYGVTFTYADGSAA